MPLLKAKQNAKFFDFLDENRLIFVVLSGRFQNLMSNNDNRSGGSLKVEIGRVPFSPCEDLTELQQQKIGKYHVKNDFG